MSPDLSPPLPTPPPSCAARLASLRADALGVAIVLLALAPADGWAQLRFMVGGEEQVERIYPVPVEGSGRQDWRDTLSDQREEREAAQARRRMTEEERGNLRRQLRDAAQGVYREEAPRGKARR